jgi:hypothetical protein
MDKTMDRARVQARVMAAAVKSMGQEVRGRTVSRPRRSDATADVESVALDEGSRVEGGSEDVGVSRSGTTEGGVTGLRVKARETGLRVKVRVTGPLVGARASASRSV